MPKIFTVAAAASIALALLACQEAHTHYEGYICSSKTRSGVAGIGVRLERSKGVDGYSDSRGFFKIPMRPAIVEDLIVSRNGRTLDTITTWYIYAGEFEEYRFVSGRRDTLFIAEP